MELPNIFEMTILNYLVALVIAVLCGGVIGLERALNHKAAGIRDNILICLGAVMYMKVSQIVALSTGNQLHGDPGRVAAQVVTGIGFIGAGAIMRQKGDIAGLTTAATIWVVAAIGVTIGIDQYGIALLLTGVTLLVLTALHGVEIKLARKADGVILNISLSSDSPELRAMITETLNHHQVTISGFSTAISSQGITLVVKGKNDPATIQLLVDALWQLPEITQIERG